MKLLVCLVLFNQCLILETWQLTVKSYKMICSTVSSQWTVNTLQWLLILYSWQLTVVISQLTYDSWKLRVESWYQSFFKLHQVWNTLTGRTFKRLCKTEPPRESHSVEIPFAQWLENVWALYLRCGQSQDTQLEGFEEKNGHKVLAFVSGYF